MKLTWEILERSSHGFQELEGGVCRRWAQCSWEGSPWPDQEVRMPGALHVLLWLCALSCIPSSQTTATSSHWDLSRRILQGPHEVPCPLDTSEDLPGPCSLPV